MHVTLIHNPSAGFGSPSRAELEMWLSDAGYAVNYQSSRTPGLTRALEQPGDLVVAAGGDGTVARVLRAVAGRDVPVAIIPIGTANNVATSLGVLGAPRDLMAALRGAPVRPMDVATASGPWGEARFVESAGLGLFASVLDDAARDADMGPLELVWARGDRMRRMLTRESAAWRRIEVDGADRSGDCFFVAAFNTPAIGPQLPLAPAADPSDGLLELLVVRPEDRGPLEEYLDALTDDTATAFPLQTTACRSVRLEWEIGSGHLDDKLWPDSAPEDSTSTDRNSVTLEINGLSVMVLIPSDR